MPRWHFSTGSQASPSNRPEIRRAEFNWLSSGPEAPSGPALFLAPVQDLARPWVAVTYPTSYHSAVVGSIMARTSEIRFAGKPPCRACSSMSCRFGAT